MFQDSGEVAIICTFIGCMTALVWRAVSLPVAIERQKQKTERQENRLDARTERQENRQETKQDRIEEKR